MIRSGRHHQLNVFSIFLVSTISAATPSHQVGRWRLWTGKREIKGLYLTLRRFSEPRYQRLIFCYPKWTGPTGPWDLITAEIAP